MIDEDTQVATLTEMIGLPSENVVEVPIVWPGGLAVIDRMTEAFRTRRQS